MIGPVFFLAFVALLVEAQYPTTRPTTPYTTEDAYPQTTPPQKEYNTQRPTDYQPSYKPNTYKPSNPPSNYESGYDTSAPNKEYAQGSYGYGHYNVLGDLYSHYPSSPIRNIRAQLKDLQEGLDARKRADVSYNRNLDIVAAKVKESTKYREEFERTIYPRVVASIDAQDKKIAHYRAQLNSLSGLRGDVKALIDVTNSIARTVDELKKRQANLRFAINSQEVRNAAENVSIVAVEDQTDGNDKLLDIIYSTRASNLARYASNVRELKESVAIVNEEKSELIDVVLTAENNSVYVAYKQAFPRKPQLAYAITELDIDKTRNDYKDYNVDETIYPRVTAEGDEKGVTISFEDKSQGWTTERVGVRLFAFTVDNERSSQGNNTTRAYGRDGAYQTSSQGSYATTKSYGGDDAYETSTKGSYATTKSYGGDDAYETSSKGSYATTKSYGRGDAYQTSTRGANATTKAYVEA